MLSGSSLRNSHHSKEMRFHKLVMMLSKCRREDWSLKQMRTSKNTGLLNITLRWLKALHCDIVSSRRKQPTFTHRRGLKNRYGFGWKSLSLSFSLSLAPSLPKPSHSITRFLFHTIFLNPTLAPNPSPLILSTKPIYSCWIFSPHWKGFERSL